jgi:hypothetical protein
MERFMRSWKFLAPLLATTLFFAAPSFAAQPDRITGPIDSSQLVALTGNVHGSAQPRFEIGRADGSKLLYGVALAFRPSAAQQQDLNSLLAQQQDRTSPNYHKWLTPAQFADRFGMTQNDIDRVSSWLESQGFTVTSVANSRNQISFNGTVAQIESVFHTEIHDYLVDGAIHFANATNPSVPAALAGAVVAISHLHNFSPKPRAKFSRMSSDPANPHFTSYVSGNHFLTPGDFATIYNLPTGLDGTGESIAIIGQSTVSAADLSNFRSAAGLPAKVPQYILYPSNSTPTRCSGDEGESDLDLEWSGGVAKNANIIFVYAGLIAGDSCGQNRTFSVWDALQQAVDNNYAPVISTSYGYCESGLGSAFVDEVQGWAQQANTQGQTIMASSGDAGAADCDGTNAPSGTLGLAVDVPAAVPEVTGMGGTEFTGDAAGTVSGGNAGADLPYWSGTTGGVDTISSALEYIPETGWNDTVENDGLLASGGGASIYFTKPSWQTGTGVPADGQRDVPDLALNASPYHDPYLICSEDGGDGTIVASCTAGFRTGVGGDLTAVGGTSCAAPSFAGIAALLNEYLINNGFQLTAGLGNANPDLYYIATNNPTAMHDVTTGNNDVPCTTGTPDCPTGTTQYGFSAGVGYDQVTGLGSVNANTLAVAWGELFTATTTSLSPSSTHASLGASVTLTATVTPATATGNVSFYNNGSTTAIGSAALSSGTATFTTTSLPGGTNSIVGTYGGINAPSTSSAVTVTITTPDFTLTAGTASPASIPAGQSASILLTVAPVNGSTQTINFTAASCSGLPAGTSCSFNPTSVGPLDGTHSQTTTLTISSAANMAIPSGLQAITVTGTASGAGGESHTANVNLTVTPTNQSFTLTPPNGITYPVTVGGSAEVTVNVANPSGGGGAPLPFVGATTTALPLTYTCSSTPALSTSEIACQISPGNGQPTSATSVTVTFVTTAKTTQLVPLGERHIFYALLLPGLFGVFFLAGSRPRTTRLLGLIVVLACSTMWLGACGGSSGGSTTPPNSGTPPGTYAVTINATTGAPTGGTPLTFALPITLTVSQ